MGRYSHYTSRLARVLEKLDKTRPKMVARMGAQIEAHVKKNIRANGQIDTGFMLNSVYVELKEGPLRPGSQGYDEAAAEANSFAISNRTGQVVSNPDERMAPRAALEQGADGFVAVGAGYAIFQEEKLSFLYVGAQDAADDFEGIVLPDYKEALSD